MPLRVLAHRNEAPLPPPPHVLAAVHSLDAEALRRYPEEALLDLAQELARRLAAEPSCICLGSGADDALFALARAFVEPGDNIVTVRPTFGMYERMALLARADLRIVPYVKRWELDPPAIVRAADRRTKLVILGHPNNPTGDLLRFDDLAWLANALPNSLIVVDEVYLALSPASLVAAVARFPNVAVVGSLSKVGALAGMRVGYITADPSIASSVRDALPPFPIGVASLAAALAYLRGGAETESFERRLEAQVERSLAALVERVGPFARDVWRGAGNFVLLDFGHVADEIVASFASRGIAVRRICEPELRGGIRICALDDESTEALIAAARHILSPLVGTKAYA